MKIQKINYNVAILIYLILTIGLFPFVGATVNLTDQEVGLNDTRITFYSFNNFAQYDDSPDIASNRVSNEISFEDNGTSDTYPNIESYLYNYDTKEKCIDFELEFSMRYSRFNLTHPFKAEFILGDFTLGDSSPPYPAYDGTEMAYVAIETNETGGDPKLTSVLIDRGSIYPVHFPLEDDDINGGYFNIDLIRNNGILYFSLRRIVGTQFYSTEIASHDTANSMLFRFQSGAINGSTTASFIDLYGEFNFERLASQLGPGATYAIVISAGVVLIGVIVLVLRRNMRK